MKRNTLLSVGLGLALLAGPSLAHIEQSEPLQSLRQSYFALLGMTFAPMDDFQSKRADFRAAAAQLAETAAAGEAGASREQFVATGGTCKACHDEYKSQDYLY